MKITRQACPCLSLTTLLLLATSLVFVGSAAGKTRLEIKEPEHRWQALPRDVTSMTVGPDGRIWYQLSTGPTGSQGDIQSAIAREFKQKSPQIRGAEIALLDTQGRAWFYFENRRKLLGFDGERWIEPTESEKQPYFRGSCPTLGLLRRGAAVNTSAGERVFFFGQTGILSYDGQEWAFLTLPEQPRRPYPLLFAASPNGKWVVAAAKGIKGLLLLKGGEWQPLPLKFEMGEHSESLVVTDEGVLWRLPLSDPLVSIQLAELAEAPQQSPPPAEEPDPHEEVARLIANLEHDLFKEREAAQAELIGRGEAILPQVKETLLNAKTLELQQRLRAVRDAIAAKRSRPLARPANARPKKETFPMVPFGNVQVGGVTALYQDARGRVLVAARATVDPSGNPIGPSLALLDASGQVSLVTEPEIVRTLSTTVYQGPLPVITPDGDKLWAPNARSSAGPVLIDWRKQRIIAEVPDDDYHHIRGVDAAGRVYLAKESFSRSLVMVHSPNLPEDRLPIEIRTRTCDRETAAVAADGTVWAGRAGDGLYYFAGVGWTKVDDWKAGTGRILACGAGGDVLVTHKHLSLWRQGERKLVDQENRGLREFIRSHREQFAQAFDGQKQPAGRPREACTIVADRQGNIWLLEQSRLQVLLGDEWRDMTEPLKKAGSRAGQAVVLSAVGDGSRIYLSDQMLAHDRGKSFLASIERGEAKFVEAPHAADSTFTGTHPVRDAQGDLWIGGNIARAAGPSDLITGHFISRLNQTGEAEQFKTTGRLVHLENTGELWFTDPFLKPSGTIRRMRGGEVVQTLELPEVDAFFHFFSDRRGSVYAISSRGLEHLVAESPDFGEYRHQATYNLSGVPRSGPLTALSSLGYLAITGEEQRDAFAHRLHLIRLPQGR